MKQSEGDRFWFMVFMLLLLVLLLYLPGWCQTEGERVNKWQEIRSGDTLEHWTLTLQQVRNFDRIMHNEEFCGQAEVSMNKLIDKLTGDLSLCQIHVGKKNQEIVVLNQEIAVRDTNLLRADSLVTLKTKEVMLQERLTNHYRDQATGAKIGGGLIAIALAFFLIFR